MTFLRILEDFTQPLHPCHLGKMCSMLVKGHVTNNEHISLLLCCSSQRKEETWKALPCKYFPKETCSERNIGNAKKKKKFNISIPFLSTAKQTLADRLQTSLWEVELKFIFRCIQLHDSPGGNKYVDLPICYINYRHCSAQLLLRSARSVENGFKSVQVHI